MASVPNPFEEENPFGEEESYAKELVEVLGIPATPKDTSDAVGLDLKPFTEIIHRPQKWFVPDFLPVGALMLVAGEQGLGKTSLCIDWAAAISRGSIPVTGGTCEPRNVLVLSNEDSESRLLEMFVMSKGDLSRAYVENEDADFMWSLADLPALEAQIARLQPALVIIDSLSTRKPDKVNRNSHGDVAPVFTALE